MSSPRFGHSPHPTSAPIPIFQTVSPGTWVNKAREEEGPEPRDTPRPSRLLTSVLGTRPFLALLLLASQEVVRSPPHGVRGPSYGPTYRVCHPAYRVRDAAYRSH
jgi:hypothetical protein